jgi:hypothetical protein
MARTRLSTDVLAATYKAFMESGCKAGPAAKALGISRGCIEGRLSTLWEQNPSLKPENAPIQGGDIPVIHKPAPTSDEVMRAHRAEQAASRSKVEASVLRSALADAQEKIVALTSLRAAKPDALNWTMPKPTLQKRGVLMPCLVLSDFQAGEVIKPAELDGMNAYNIDIFHERYRLAIEKTIEFATHHVGAAEFPGCQYWQLGDVISGGLHFDLSETDDLPSVPSIRAVFQAECEGIKQLRARFKRVHVVRINGNHDRTTPKPRSKNQAGLSFGTLLSWWLQTAFEGDPNVTFHVPASPDALVRVFDWNVVLQHGDRMGSSGGKGFIGTEATILRGHHQMFKSWSDGGQTPDMICSGHYHTETKTVRGYGNGSLAGYSQYARDLRAIPDAARQWLLFMHQSHKVTHNISLRLSEFPKRRMLDAAA